MIHEWYVFWNPSINSGSIESSKFKTNLLIVI
jgi:hypothetical protein